MPSNSSSPRSQHHRLLRGGLLSRIDWGRCRSGGPSLEICRGALSPEARLLPRGQRSEGRSGRLPDRHRRGRIRDRGGALAGPPMNMEGRGSTCRHRAKGLSQCHGDQQCRGEPEVSPRRSRPLAYRCCRCRARKQVSGGSRLRHRRVGGSTRALLDRAMMVREARAGWAEVLRTRSTLPQSTATLWPAGEVVGKPTPTRGRGGGEDADASDGR